MKERISNAADFPGLAVYREALPGGPVYSVEFRNKEKWPPMSGTESRLGVFLWSLFWFAVGMGLIGWGFYTAFYLPHWGLWVLFFLLLPFPVFAIANLRPTVRRAIELDFGREEFRVKRGGRVTLRKPLPRRNIQLALEPHWAVWDGASHVVPEALRHHCLVGYFGMAGTDRAVLLCRYERHPIGGLREVVAAVMMAWEAGCREVD